MTAISLEGKVAIVTGGNTGIGKAVVLGLAEQGANVCIDYVANEQATEDLEKKIIALGDQAIGVDADVSKVDDLQMLIEQTVDRFGRLDVMVNNAGIAGPASKPLLETTEEDWDAIMAVNLRGVFLVCKRAVQQMLTQEVVGEARGRIVNIASQHGIIACPGDCAYGVSKAGVAYITRQIAVDYAQDRIVCNAVAPGKIVTGRPGVGADPAFLDYARRRTPWPRLGAPSDVAAAAAFLASDMASYVTGHCIPVDGGTIAASGWYGRYKKRGWTNLPDSP